MSDNVEDTTGDNDQENIQTLLEKSQKPLYASCTKFSVLSGVLRLFGVKAKHRWTDTSFTDLLEAVHEMLPDGNELPLSLYQAKKMMCPTELEVERIHACPNDCILYRDTYANIHRCPICKESRYKSETKISENEMKYGPPAKILWYLPIIPRLKQLFANEKDAKLLRWHSDERKKDGKLRHVADSPQWRKINNKHDEFGGEIRNIRFGLSSDGINPFGNMSSKHSTWPVLLCVYNLPPWLCMKRKYIMMSLLIEGPKQPGNDIDVYLAPLIDDLKTLWDKGVKVYDAYKRETFTLRAMIFCTISDFPAYGNLSGYSTKGKFACPVCEDQTSSRWLPNCKKTVFMGHRRSLVRNHPYRKMKREFDGTTEYGRVPSSYPANIKKLVSVQDCKLVGMKSHDCHVFMTHMIPIAIRGLLPNNVRHTITKLCLFFNMIHSKVIDLEVLDSWQSDIILTLCELEMYFPPSFFDVMVHLVSHIIAEIKACGLVYLHYMYPFERYMGVLKGYVRNQVRPEGSIITGYLAEELIEFGNDVMKGVRNIGIPHSRHEGRLAGVGTIGLRMIDPDRDALKVAHSVVLQHMTCLTSYIEQHKQMLRVTHRGRTNKWYQSKHNEEFSYWLKDIVTENLGKPNVDKTVERLGEGPRCVVRSYQGYDINGYTFYTEMQDEKSTVQNSRVTLIASTMEFDRSNHDAMATIAKNSFYGVIQEIWELDYNTFTIPLFKCKWVTNNARGVMVDEIGFTLVDLSTDGYTSDPFILAKLATQVFYVKDLSKSRWHIVLHGKRRILGVENVVDEDEYDQFDELPPFTNDVPPLDDDTMEITYLRSDHNEGLWVE
ncbi:hypothetical protein Tco_0681893 [Tanacetum coccineum]|uniref:Transposase n=2 Tax=Tanacetum coccineum TaxID=301880 RepID=A0ABQ4XPM6_9ASTR